MRIRSQTQERINGFVSIAVFAFFVVVIMISFIGLSGNFEKLSVFTTIFLAIFIEALPFLILGTLSSGIVEVFVSQQWVERFFHQPPLIGAVLGGLMGLFFPVCECGVVPLVRRLFRKGMRVPTGIAFLLAAPVVNPVVILSTASAFGVGRMLFYRVGLTFLVAVITGLIFSFASKEEVLLAGDTDTLDCCNGHDDLHSDTSAKSLLSKVIEALRIAAGEFFEMGHLLAIGAAIAALTQVVVPQAVLLQVGKGPIISVLVMILLSLVLSLCSTVDSFVALGFSELFSNGSILAFLVFGPMIDLKSILLFFQVIKPRSILYLILIPLALVILTGVASNLFLTW